MKMDKTLVIGFGNVGAEVAASIGRNAQSDIILVDTENKQQMQELKTQSGLQEFPIYPYHMAHQMHEVLTGEKTFICKGNGHQYREVRIKEGSTTSISWVCQCVRKL